VDVDEARRQDLPAGVEPSARTRLRIAGSEDGLDPVVSDGDGSRPTRRT
jgi:hypothetical protein